MSATDVEHRDESGRRVWWGLALVATGIVVLMLIAIQMFGTGRAVPRLRTPWR